MSTLILGIDPGSRQTGYGLLEIVNRRQRVVSFGVFDVSGEGSHARRLKCIYDHVYDLLKTHPPDECAVEMPVYGKNPQSMLKLGRAQAAAMMAALNRGVPVSEYTPKEVKSAVSGNGNATKKQVSYMVRALLSIDGKTDKMLDAYDALAVGLCHAHRLGSVVSGGSAPANGQAPQTSGGSTQHKDWASFVRENPDRIA